MIRLFAAIELPESHKKKLFNITRQLQGIRQVPQHQLHLTLKFLGDQQQEYLPEIINSLTTISQAPLFVEIIGPGTFLRHGRPDIIWVGIKSTKELLALHNNIEQSLQAFAAKEKRRFKPHITVARTQKSFRPHLAQEFIKEYKDFTLPPFFVKHLTLFESRLSSTGATHIERAICAFKEKNAGKSLLK